MKCWQFTFEGFVFFIASIVSNKAEDSVIFGTAGCNLGGETACGGGRGGGASDLTFDEATSCVFVESFPPSITCQIKITNLQ